MTGSQGFPMTKLMAVNTGLARLCRLRLRIRGLRRIFVPNFVKIGQSVAEILICGFFKMAAAAILDFQICDILLADGIWRAQTHHCTKFRQNQSFLCIDIVIFRIFKMAVAAIWDF